jgi:hypothetical protein
VREGLHFWYFHGGGAVSLGVETAGTVTVRSPGTVAAAIPSHHFLRKKKKENCTPPVDDDDDMIPAPPGGVSQRRPPPAVPAPFGGGDDAVPFASRESAPSPPSQWRYRHHRLLACFMIPSGYCILILPGSDGHVPLYLFVISWLLIYAADLAQLTRDSLGYLVWGAMILQSLVTFWFQLLRLDDDDDGILKVLFGSAVATLYFAMLALWWMLPSSEPAVPEALLHALVPPISAALLTAAMSAAATPLLWAGFLVLGLCGLGAAAPSAPGESSFIVLPPVARGHLWLLTSVPPILYLLTVGIRRPSLDDLCDLLLCILLPQLLQLLLDLGHTTEVLLNPYGRRSPPISHRRLRILLVTLVAAAAGQERYLRPLAQRWARPAPFSSVGFHFYSTLGTLALFAVGDLAAGGQPLFYSSWGEYQEDVIQMLLSVAGLGWGRALGLPWSMTPLPVLGLLGLVLWLSTRLLRYWMLVLFAAHAAGVMFLNYRFIGLPESTATVTVLGVTMHWIRFGLLLTLASVAVGGVAGGAVRASGGYMAGWIRAGIGPLLVLYSVVLMILEITLLQTSTAGSGGTDAEGPDEAGAVYGVSQVMGTSVVLIAMVLFMQRIRWLHDGSASVVLSLALGKAMAVYTDSVLGPNAEDPDGTHLVFQSVMATVFCAILWVPQVFLEPVHMKHSVRRSSWKGGGGGAADLPPNAARLIGVYAFGFVPLSLLVTLPDVVFPLMNAVSSQLTHESYYPTDRPVSEYVGAAVALWGLSVFSMLNHYLPDGGGETWKKSAALAFVLGVGAYCAAPTLQGSVAHNPYAPLSSLGQRLLLRRKSRTGGWGILAAAMATLLAASGPLELKERRHASGRKDKYLFLRTLLFSVLFGGGVAWFIVVQCMSESDWVFVILTLLASSLLAFLGTVAAVLGFFVEPDNFDEVQQIAKTWFYGFFLFLPIAGVPHLLRSGAPHLFSAGGWLVPYLVVGCLSSLAFALSLRHRRTKDSRTKGLGNLACVISWLLAIIVLYGRFGVAAVDINNDNSTLIGIPISVLGTMVLSCILLVLEGESTSSSQGRAITRVSVTTSTHRNDSTWWRLPLPQLTATNRWFPVFAGSVVVFLCVSLYCTLLRGIDLSSVFGTSATDNNEDLYEGLIGFKAEKEDTAVAALLFRLGEQGMIPNMFTSGYLSTMSFWTSKFIIFPILNLVGMSFILSNFVLLVKQYWWNETVASDQVTSVLPLNAFALLICSGLPTLLAATLLILAGSVMQYTVRQRSEYNTRMQI